jgi:GTP-binding protein
MSFTVAIVGRPNVGKSSLFNRLVGKRLALVSDMPGLTRDRREAEADLGGRSVTLIDTAGLEEADADALPTRMRQQSEAAIADADLILFVVDARAGVTPADEVFAEMARRSGKPILLAANKAEGRAGEAGAMEAYALGLGEPLAVSAEHGEGLSDLAGEIRAQMGEERGPTEDADGDRPIKVAIVGRPNAGKSTLVNALFGAERMITGPEAGITRDSISVDLTWRNRALRLFDTAGLRRKARIHELAEQLSASDALRAIRFAEVVVLLLDADCPLEKQDLTIADLVAQEGRALVIGVNKWDTVEDVNAKLREIREQVTRLLPQVKGVTIAPVSALRLKGLDRLMNAVFEAYDVWNRRIATSQLNRWLIDAVGSHPPPAAQGKRIRLRFMTQPNARPPTFVAFCSKPDDLPESYKRYLVNGLREQFDLPGTPIRLHLRKGDNPYA